MRRLFLKVGNVRRRLLPVLGILLACGAITFASVRCDSKDVVAQPQPGAKNDAPNSAGKAAPAKIDQLAETDNQVAELKQRLHEQRVESEKLRYELSQARKKRDAEAASPQGATNETKTATAEATVKYQESLEQLSARLDKLTEKLDKLATGAGEKPVNTAGTTTDQEWKQAVAGAENPQPPSSQPTPTGSASDESQQAFKEFAAGVATVLCVAQPELCPFLAQFVAMMNLFSSDEDRQTFLEGVSNLAIKKPLTDKQRQAVTTVLKGPMAGQLPPAAIRVLALIGQSDPTVKQSVDKAVEDARKNSTLSIHLALIDTLGPTSTVANVAAIQTSLGGHYPNPGAKKDFLACAAAKAISKPVLDELEKIP